MRKGKKIMSNNAHSLGVNNIGSILAVFSIAFFAVSILALVVSIVRCKEINLAKSCRNASWMAFIIGIILLYLRFVLT